MARTFQLKSERLKLQQLFRFANDIALATPEFFDIKGPGAGNIATNSYLTSLGAKAKSEFGQDFSEQRICGANSLAVDFYFPDEETIVEIALGLKNPNTEYEKDILKAVMAKTLGNGVSCLCFISKPGAVKKNSQPGRLAFKKWLEQSHEIKIETHELGAT